MAKLEKNFSLALISVAIAGQNLVVPTALAGESGTYHSSYANMLDNAFDYYVQPKDVLRGAVLLGISGGAAYLQVKKAKNIEDLVKSINNLDQKIIESRNSQQFLIENQELIRDFQQNPKGAALRMHKKLAEEMVAKQAAAVSAQKALKAIEPVLKSVSQNLSRAGQFDSTSSLSAGLGQVSAALSSEVASKMDSLEEARVAANSGSMPVSLQKQLNAHSEKANQMSSLLEQQDKQLAALKKIAKIEKVNGSNRIAAGRIGRLSRFFQIGTLLVAVDQVHGFVIMAAVQKNPGVLPTIGLVQNSTPEDWAASISDAF